jgi:chromosome segregation and condensation protein ScpB
MQIATLEVLACIAFRQPISEAEIDPLFDAKSAGSLWRQREASTRSALKT